MTVATRLTRSLAAVAIATGLVGCDLLLRLGEDLKLTAESTSLGIGESVQVTVQKKRWFRTAELTDPSNTTYSTTSESALVVEPDGWVTCVGTYGAPTESAWISATNGNSHGHLSFALRSEGPGPTLDLLSATADLPPVPDNVLRSPFVPCCSTLLALKEGQQMRFKVQSRASRRELTSSATGTRYTLFFGSGVPNDPHPSRITGGPDTVSARSFILDDKEGVITAPDSIGRLNHARVVVFFRNGPLVGWREIVVIHK